MDERRLKKRIDSAIMDINAFRPLTPEEKRQDVTYAILLVVLSIGIPLVGCTVATVLGHRALAFGILALCWGASAAVGLTRRHQIIRDFYQVKDVEPLVHVEAVEQAPLPAALDDTALVYAVLPHPFVLAFVYNWLCNRDALRTGDPLTIYQVYRAALQGLDDTADAHAAEYGSMLCVPLSALTINEANTARFFAEFRRAGASMLNLHRQTPGTPSPTGGHPQTPEPIYQKYH